ncbi:hypothetical protein GCM10010294_41560 [Streptomyces griseoloalbus]|uniref:HGxxPAAW family protein n=1 Tax=Streptomyces griseoloalbus TaxID=67303 RepID=UPI0018762214|nr:hypothetical protein GCM10010294_41560 [Streptomyces griseoloalbus]
MSAHPYDHGHTVAGWTGFAIAGVGTAVLGLGVCTVSGPLLVGGPVIALAGLLVTWVLHLAGWGKPSGPRPREQWGWRVRDLTVRQGHTGCLGCRLAGRGRARRGPAPAAGRVPVPVRGSGAEGADPARAGQPRS